MRRKRGERTRGIRGSVGYTDEEEERTRGIRGSVGYTDEEEERIENERDPWLCRVHR
jgi:hypothetical protein